MSDKNRTWKEYLFRSGLPLENDVRRVLDEFGCFSSYEYSYLKQDENQLQKEFSFDIDSSYIKGCHFFELMVECKYRHETTKWIFTPAKYGGFKELHELDFLHAQDFFVETKFPYRSTFPIQLGPACGKGVEITSTGTNEKSIVQAVNQLAYAFAPKVSSAIEHQVFDLLAGEHIFYHVPIIVTTAHLFRLNDDVDMEAIKGAKDIEDVAEEHDLLVMNNDIGMQLQQYNSEQFSNFRERIGDDLLTKKNKSFAENMDHFFNVMATFYCPSSILVLRHDESRSSYKKLFDLISNTMNPSEELESLLEEQRKRDEEIVRQVEEDFAASFNAGSADDEENV